jgi:predicted HTH transcriptional regulator
MTSATEAITRASELTAHAERLDRELNERIAEFESTERAAREDFYRGLEADQSRLKVARREARAAIRSAGAAMGDGTPHSRRTSPRSRGALSAADALAFIASNPGTNAKAVADATGASAATARKVIDGLVADGSVRKEGERRGTKLFAA